jgi:hypothetical protein
MTINLSPTEIIAAIGVLLALVMVWRSGTRRARRAADTAHAASRLASLAGQVFITAGVIVGAQWVAMTYAANTTLFWVALTVPALITAYVTTRALVVTSLDVTYRRGGRR